MRIHLIRHGQTHWNKERRIQGQSESTLNDEGRQQASALRPILQHFEISKVYCSSSVRTRETAALLFEDKNIEIEYRDELREIFLGPWEGFLQTETKEKYPESFKDFWHFPHRFTLTGAETFAQVQARGLAEVQRIRQEAAGEDVAVVSHGVLIKSILCQLEGRPLEHLWEPPEMHNCSHSIIEIDTKQGSTPQIIQYAGALQ
ncbi:MAG: histidine phosphatase family protein [Pseudomonadota bacterium]